MPQDNSTDFIKRVIGLPGDRIQMINDVAVSSNGKPVPKVMSTMSKIMFTAIWTNSSKATGDENRQTLSRDSLPGGKSYVVPGQV